ncbi:hypothetical protein SKAU_G00091820 [Synaphobranchus kaupii]|uniref:Uncharacterized protein n=1 Tax=Synaphobranchus kaupii TaxID=118154 RepID=A0A9Q1J684_SYNKA|nr:hypothetical protein SKAU_G00091820 [Synaphobranchus kaupii]
MLLVLLPRMSRRKTVPLIRLFVSEPEAPAAVQNGANDKAEAVGTNRQPSASNGQESENCHPDAKEDTQAEPALEAACGETKSHGENGSSGAGCDGKGSGEGEDDNPKDIMAHDREIIPQEDGLQEIAKQEEINSQEAAHQTENASPSSKDEKNLNQEQRSDGKCCSGNPVAQSEKMAGKVQPHKEH